jgi:lysophospholipase L1-like esterase
MFGFNPQYVVLQFGATDAQCPVRARNRSAKYNSKFDVDQASAVPRSGSSSLRKFLRWEMDQDQPYNLVSPLRWKIASMIGLIRKIEPITALPAYIAAIEHMVDECIAAKITPVVLSPFVFGSNYTMRNAIRYTKALHELHLRVPDMVFIDCIRVLAAFPKSMILLNDGFHLSGEGHSQIGKAVGQAIVAHVENLHSDMEFGAAAQVAVR